MQAEGARHSFGAVEHVARKDEKSVGTRPSLPLRCWREADWLEAALA